ncbi:heavy metal translocating P-type ATPase [Lacrimispora algidixylanolytica]|uniref:Cadmium-translocating P-type ATPase n=1 Tax=Lacrimispora algidixylanolytica TaxID=94868 RepID=A0A419T377_9FIRM|nr:heavy metal translocating P-type ATPase [Lacrimispora algidixylanolytica]RKD31905.1 cadmium-translocating P-type ATPase [Lacrimispora algidixylanolytica]
MKKRLIRIIIGSIIYLMAFLIKPEISWFSPAMFTISYIIIGGDIVWKAIRNILRGKVFDENFLMTVATVGAFCIREFPEAVAVMLFYQVGELFQSYAVSQSRRSISELMDIRPDYANLVIESGDTTRVDPDDVKIGDTILVAAGEKIPLDGTVIDGTSMIDTSALTGESVPREAAVGSDVLSGCVNINGILRIKVTKEYGESTVSKILDLVENASSKKSNSENFITKFAAVYTPIVVISALLLAVIPPLVIPGASFEQWLYRALTFLVVSCPCALVISVPLSFFGGIGGASKAGILVKGSNYLEALAQTELVVFDKTGTLTQGVFDVQEIYAKDITKEELLALTAYAESYSNHPISLSLKRAYGKEIDKNRLSNVEEISGLGIIASVDGKVVAAGNSKLMTRLNISYSEDVAIGTVVHVAVDNSYAGYIVISDKVKPDAALAIQTLKAAHVKQTVMLTGDSKSVGEKVAKELQMDQVYTELLPGDKVDKLEELFTQKSAKGKLAFVGDGINDAPVLARADIGVAMGGLGSDAAIEAADVVIMTDEPSKLGTAIKISKKTLGIVRQNIIFALAVKIGVLILSAFGLATMWEAVFSDVGVSVIAILNALRALNITKLKS